jgi:hypothetical protein
MARLDQDKIGDIGAGQAIAGPNAAPGNTHIAGAQKKAPGIMEVASENFRNVSAQLARGDYDVGRAEARGQRIADDFLQNVDNAAQAQIANEQIGEIEGGTGGLSATFEQDQQIQALTKKRDSLLKQVDRGFLSTADAQLRVEKMARQLAVDHPNPDRVYAAAGSALSRSNEFKMLAAQEKSAAATSAAHKKKLLDQATQVAIMHGLNPAVAYNLSPQKILEFAGPYMQRQASIDQFLQESENEKNIQEAVFPAFLAKEMEGTKAKVFATLQQMEKGELDGEAALMAVNDIEQIIAEQKSAMLSMPGAKNDLINAQFKTLDNLIAEIKAAGNGERAEALLKQYTKTEQLKVFTSMERMEPALFHALMVAEATGQDLGMANMGRLMDFTAQYAGGAIHKNTGTPDPVREKHNEEVGSGKLPSGKETDFWRLSSSEAPSTVSGDNARFAMQELKKLSALKDVAEHSPAVAGAYISPLARDSVLMEAISDDFATNQIVDERTREELARYSKQMLENYFLIDVPELLNETHMAFVDEYDETYSQTYTLRDYIELEAVPNPDGVSLRYRVSKNMPDAVRDGMLHKLEHLNKVVGGVSKNYINFLSAMDGMYMDEGLSERMAGFAGMINQRLAPGPGMWETIKGVFSNDEGTVPPDSVDFVHGGWGMPSP